MKYLTLFTLFISINIQAAYELDLDFSFKKDAERLVFKDKIEVRLDEIRRVPLSQTNRFVEIKLTNRIPVELFKKGEHIPKEQYLIDLKLIEKRLGKEVILASPQILSVLKKKATMEAFEENSKTPFMSLKIIPKRLLDL